MQFGRFGCFAASLNDLNRFGRVQSKNVFYDVTFLCNFLDEFSQKTFFMMNTLF